MTKRLTIAICTYDRINELRMCLNSIKEYMGDFSFRTGVIVVDNKGQVEVLNLVDSFRTYYDIAYLPCEKIGLSNARNMAAFNAKADYVFYLDDDAKILATTLSEVFVIIDKYDFDIFGGSYIPYYIGVKPTWLPLDYGASKYTQKFVGVTDHSLSGSVFIMRTKLINAIEFDPRYGMSGKSIGYGEETYFQQRALELGYSVGFNPNLIVEHLVAKYKYKISWQLKSYFYLGLHSNFDKLNYKSKIKRLANDIFFFIPAAFFFSIKRFLTQKNFYVNNLMVDSFANVFIFFGRLLSLVKH